MIDWSDIRRQFPAVERRVYLNTAGGAPLSRRAAAAGGRYYELTLEDGDIHWDAWLEQVEEVRGRVARLIGADADEVAFVGNASSALSIAAHMLAGRGGVVTVEDEFPSCTLPWLQLGYDVGFVRPRRDGSVTVADIEEELASWRRAGGRRSDAADRHARPGLLAVSFVQFKSGFRFDLTELGELCAAHELELVVDATQGLGAFPLDVSAARVGFLASSGYKWLTAGYGVAILHVRSGLLDRLEFPVVGWRSARDPYALTWDQLDLTRRAAGLEQGHPPFAGVFALGAALELVEEIGVEAIAARILELMSHLHGRLAEAGFEVLSTTDPEHMSGICVVDVPEAARAVRQLAEREIVVSSRGRGIRVSIHHYNDEDDVDRFVEALAEIRPPGKST